ncbi:hypothetical protein V2G26_017229 [Clonostachys chloroleuca]
MRRSPWICVLAFLLGSGLARENAPTADNFYRRVNPRATVFGNYLYVDGGEVAEKGNPSNRPNNPVNATLALDLSKSWTPKDAEFIETEKPDSISPLWKNAFFHDDAKKTFYIWGGRIFRTPWGVPPPVKVWKFVADDKGGGAWSTEDDNHSFDDLVRSEDGAYVSTEDAGFWIGGSAFPETHTDANSDIPGVVSYNFTTKEWKNHTEAPFSDDGTVNAATATYIPSFGPNGLIMLLGGLEHTIPKATNHLSFETVHFFDPVTMKWYKQPTTGTKPQKRNHHCSVGVQGNGTYEIFIYGGWNQDYEKILDDMYVLTIPGFNWAKVDFDKDPRTEFDCVVAGNRQMVTVGGAGVFGGWTVKDSYPKGLGIFDLTELKWKDEFTPDAPAYKTPDLVQKWYDQGGLDRVEWSDDVKALFAKKDSSSTTSSASPGATSTSSSTTDQTNQDLDKTSSDSKPNNTGAIAGGVVGGLAALALIGVLIFFVLRRRNGKAGEMVEIEQQPSEIDGRSVAASGWSPGMMPPPPRFPTASSGTPDSSRSRSSPGHAHLPSELSSEGERRAELA